MCFGLWLLLWKPEDERDSNSLINREYEHGHACMHACGMWLVVSLSLDMMSSIDQHTEKVVAVRLLGFLTLRKYILRSSFYCIFLFSCFVFVRFVFVAVGPSNAHELDCSVALPKKDIGYWILL